MANTIFWSWQSDRSERESRHLIREALIIALDRLTADSEIEERLEIDHDTRGLPGSPDIVASILEKIDAASVFVADITPIAVSDRGKHIANPNVLIELGYAKKSLGVGRVVTIWNTAFTQSRPEDLPFDLRGRRGPITFSLAAGASRKDFRQARVAIVEALVDRIGTCLDHLPTPPASSLPWQQAIEGDPSLWITPGQPITINEDWGSGAKTFIEGGRWYVRILPTHFEPGVLDSGIHGPVMGNYGGYSCGQTTGGLMTYAGSVRSGSVPELDAASMWFRPSGEIWAFHTQVGGDFRGRQVFHGDHIPEQWAMMLQQGLGKLVSNGARGPFHVRLGVTGLTGLYWGDINSLGGAPPIALEPALEVEFSVAGASPVDWTNEFVGAWTSLRRVFALPAPAPTAVQQVISKATR